MYIYSFDDDDDNNNNDDDDDDDDDDDGQLWACIMMICSIDCLSIKEIYTL